MSSQVDLSQTDLEDLYIWLDGIPLSRPKKKIERDFADGILVAEVIQYYLPDMINMNNYVINSTTSQKKINWKMLNRKVLIRLGLPLNETLIRDLSDGKSGTIEVFLFNLRKKIDQEIEARQNKKSQNTLSLSPKQSIVSMNNNLSEEKNSSRTNRSTGNLSERWISRLFYEELKQQCLQLQEETEVLHAKIRRLEHLVQLKDIQITELTNIIEDYKYIKPPMVNENNNYNKTKKK